MLTFDVLKNHVETYEDRIAFMQKKCKQLLADMKRKMFGGIFGKRSIEGFCLFD